MKKSRSNSANVVCPFPSAFDLALEGKVRRIPVDISGSNTNVS